nr:polyprotein [Stenotaphrum nepovirus]
MSGVSGGAATPAKCGPSCGVGERVFSKAAVLRACKDGDLTRDARCHYCGAMAVVVKMQPQLSSVDARKKQTPMKGVRVAGPKKTRSVVRHTPRKFKDLVQKVASLELVWPAPVLRQAEEPAKRAAPLRKVVSEGQGSALPLWVAPSWLVPQEPKVAPPQVSRSLTQRQEFALLKKRLVLKGKRLIREAKGRRIRRSKKLAAKEAVRVAQRENVRKAVFAVWRRYLLAKLGHSSNGNVAAAPSPSVVKQWRAQEQRQALLTADLAVKKVLSRQGQKECPHMRAREQPARVVPEPTTPWASLGLSVLAYRPTPIDGTLGAVCAVALQQGFVRLKHSCAVAMQRGVVHLKNKCAVALQRGVAHLKSRSAPILENSAECQQQLVPSWVRDQQWSPAPLHIGRYRQISFATNVRTDEPGVPFWVLNGSWIPPCLHIGRYRQISFASNVRTSEPKIPQWVLDGTWNPSYLYIGRYQQISYASNVHSSLPAWAKSESLLQDCQLSGPSNHLGEEEEVVELAEESEAFYDAETLTEEKHVFLDQKECYVKLREASLEGVAELTQNKCLQILGRQLCKGPALFPPRLLFQRCSHRPVKVEEYKYLTRFGSTDTLQHGTCAWCREKGTYYSLVSNKCYCWYPSPSIVLATHSAPEFYTAPPLFRKYNPRSIIPIEEDYTWFGIIYHPAGTWGDISQYCEVEEPEIENSSFFSKVWNRVVVRPDGPNTVRIPKGTLRLTTHSGIVDTGREVSEIQERMQDRDADAPVGSVDQLVSVLQKRSAKVAGAGENRVADKKVLTEKMVFHHPGIVQKLRDKGGNTKIAANLNSDRVLVRMQPQGKPTFTPLPRMTEDQLRKLAEKGFGSTASVALDLGIQSHIPQGMPTVAFMNVMDTRSEKPEYASLCGSYVDLGRDRAKTLCLPLANFPLNKSLEDSDDVLHGLVLATYFQDPTGFAVGKPAFQYGSLEFQEYKPSAYSDYSRVRDRWDEIAKRQDTPGDRVLAGFSVLGAVSQDYNQSLPEFESISLQCPPKNKPVVSTYREPKRFDDLSRHASFRMPATGFGAATNRALDDGKVYSRVIDRGFTEPNKMARGEVAPPRMSTTLSGYVAPLHYSTYTQFTVPKDAAGGKLLKRERLRDMLSRVVSAAEPNWMKSVSANLKVSGRISMGSNLMAGTALALVCDAFNRSAEFGDTTFPVKLGNMMPLALFPMADATARTFSFDLGELIGYPQHFKDDNFANVYFILYVVDTNESPAEADWSGTIMWRVEESNSAPIVTTLPFPEAATAKLDLWRGPAQFKQNVPLEQHTVALNFTNKQKFLTNRQPGFNFNMAKLGMYAGYRGWLVGKIVRTGPAIVQADLYLTIASGAAQSYARLLQYEGWELPGGQGDFRLRLNNAYMATSAYEQDSLLYVTRISGPVAPASISASFCYMVYLDHIEFDVEIPPIVTSSLAFDWCVITPETDDFGVRIPARLSDIILKNKAKVHMNNHPLAKMVATSGMMRGKLTMVIQWMYESAVTTPKGYVWAGANYGQLVSTSEDENTRFSVTRSKAFPEPIRIPLIVGDVSGFIASGGRGAYEAYVNIYATAAKEIKRMVLSVELDSGFEFRGPTISPIVS